MNYTRVPRMRNLKEKLQLLHAMEIEVGEVKTTLVICEMPEHPIPALMFGGQIYLNLAAPAVVEFGITCDDIMLYFKGSLLDTKKMGFINLVLVHEAVHVDQYKKVPTWFDSIYENHRGTQAGATWQIEVEAYTAEIQWVTEHSRLTYAEVKKLYASSSDTYDEQYGEGFTDHLMSELSLMAA